MKFAPATYVDGQLNLVGQRFHRLVVVSLLDSTPSGKRWKCLCDCGRECVKYTGSLRRKSQQRIACPGCRPFTQSDAAVKHGGRCQNTLGTESLYQIWKSIRNRCSNKANPYYGGKGVTVCAEWSDYAAFRSWALAHGWMDVQGVTRGDRMSIERIDPALGYAPANCEWIPGRENARRMAIRPRNV